MGMSLRGGTACNSGGACQNKAGRGLIRSAPEIRPAPAADSFPFGIYHLTGRYGAPT
jgi:hypothetical protein